MREGQGAQRDIAWNFLQIVYRIKYRSTRPFWMRKNHPDTHDCEGAQRITSGLVQILGEPTGTSKLHRLVSYISQNLSIYPDMSVADNVTYFARLAGAARSSVEEAIETVQLSPQRNRIVSTLSGG
ncbi:MAG: hypothetical protein E6167_00625 [Varibaculum cambriense]|nr:hypothetical protein [Varibaculum cambriense]